MRIIDCGLAEYRKILDLQLKLQEQRRSNQIFDTVLIVEHPPVITLGARKAANKFVVNEEQIKSNNIDIIETRRGGGADRPQPGSAGLLPNLKYSAIKLEYR